MRRLRVAVVCVLFAVIGAAHADENFVNVQNVTPTPAVPNDGLDDTAGIQGALALNATVYFPPGLYEVNGIITLNAKYVTLLGYGATIKKTSGTGSHLFEDKAAAADGLTVLGLTFDLNRGESYSCSTSPAHSAFFFIRTSDLTFRDCKFRNGVEEGLKLYKTQNVVVDNCTFEKFCDNGIQLSTPPAAVEGFTGSKPDQDGRNLRVVNSRFYDIDNGQEGAGNGCGILVGGGSTVVTAADVVIANNHFEKCMRGVWFEHFGKPARRVTVEDNTFYMCHAHGIGVVGVATATVAGNTLEDIGTFNPPGSPGTSEIVGVSVSGSVPSPLSSDVTVTDNVFRETRGTPYFQYGVRVAATQRATVKNNRAYGMTVNEITVDWSNVTASTIVRMVPPLAKVSNSAAQLINSSTAPPMAPLTWSSESEDTDSMFTTTSNDRITINTPGKYVLRAQVVFTSNATGYRKVRIFDSGGNIVAERIAAAVNGDDTTVGIEVLVNAATPLGQYYQVKVEQNSGVQLLVSPTSWFSANWWAGD